VECEQRGEASDGGRVGGAGATHDDGEDVNFSARQVAAESVGHRGMFVADKVCGVREVSVCEILPFADWNFFY
jgi:hypothetical protein